MVDVWTTLALTHCGLVTLCGVGGDLGQSWFRRPSHCLIRCWLTIIEVLWHSFQDIISTEMSKIPIYRLCLKSTHLKSQPYLPEDNELINSAQNVRSFFSRKLYHVSFQWNVSYHDSKSLEILCLSSTHSKMYYYHIFHMALQLCCHTQNTASAPSHPIQHPTAGTSTHMTPVGCVMAGCCQINYILTNIGRRNSIRILNQHPLFWNILIWTQFICFINLFAF